MKNQFLTKGEKVYWGFVVVWFIVMVCISGCGTVKSTVKSDVSVNQVTNTIADTATQKVTEVKTYGDTLKANNFIPFAFAADSATQAKPDTFTVTSESKGIKTIQKFIPSYTKGHLSGFTDDNTSIAKAIQTTDTHEATQGSVTETTVKDSIAHVASVTTKTNSLFGLPSWVLWIAGIGIVIAGLYIVYRISPLSKI